MHFANASDALQQTPLPTDSTLYVAVADACSHRAIAKQVSRGTRWLLVGVSDVDQEKGKQKQNSRQLATYDAACGIITPFSV